MFDVLHATWKDKHWVAYTLNKDLLGTYKVGQPVLLENGDTKRYFCCSFFQALLVVLIFILQRLQMASGVNPKILKWDKFH